MTTMTHDTPVRNHLRAGLLFALLSASSFGLSGPLARGLMNAGWSPAAVVTVRVLLGGLVLLPIALYQLHGNWNLLRRNASLLLGYGLLAVAGAQLAYFNAVAHMDVGVALLVEYTAPVAVIVWLWLRHQQRPGRVTVLGALIAVVGLILVLDLISGVDTSWIGIAWSLGAMVGASAYFILSARGDTEVPGSVLATSGLLIGGLAILIAGLAGVVPMRTATAEVSFQGFTTPWWAPVIALGVVTASLSYMTGIAGARRLGSRLASFVALTEVLAAIVFAWALLGQTPRPIQLLGGALILIGVVVVKLGEPAETTTATAEAAPISDPAAA
ncbi:EamA family transporter [Nocardia sp. IFM 10818]